MNFDTHVHGPISHDSIISIEELLSVSKESNSGIIITDHMDITESKGLSFNPLDYFEKYNSIRSDKILLGIELGMTKKFYKENKAIIDNFNFDYVLGSLHFHGDIDLCRSNVYDIKNKKELYVEYLKNIKENLMLHDYIDSMGHIDYICRYAKYHDNEIYIEEFKEEIKDIIEILLQKNIAIEINTRRFNNENAINNLKNIYTYYKKLGGEIVTIGSDAHSKNNILKYFEQAMELCRELKLQPVYFKNRECINIKI